ncbi:MAG: GNAT family N-acetyltransferase [Clostridia bacterium]|nr:GNAT family N-acetyltransferase [Clostridia bacterium]
MFEYKKHFDSYCKETGLELNLCFDMPEGYETANGMFDDETKSVYINAKMLEKVPDFEKAFFLFHELRHAAQYLKPEQFPEMIRRSLQYVIQYDGTCYKLVNGDYVDCKLEGGEERFTELYLGQPHEADANNYAYEQTRKIFGEPEELKKLHGFWMPKQPIPDETYQTVYAEIDEKVDNRTVPLSAFILARPTEAYAEQIMAFKEEFADCLDWLHGARGLRYSKDPEEWFRYIAENEENYTQFLYVRTADSKIVGMIGVRHQPDEPLETWGGHIGYCICPSERKKGYATQMLHDVLPYCKSLGLDRVLLTAGDENVGSVRTILANGGVLESYVITPRHDVPVGRYWIDV